MATIVYKSARLLINASEISAELHNLSLTYTAEILDETSFGDDTRIHKGGLTYASLAGDAYADFSLLGPDLLWNGIGVDDYVVSVFPNGITEGVASGYSMKAVEKDLALGGTVGTLEGLKFSFDGRGFV